MAGEWREVALGDLFKVKHGFAFKGEFFTDEPQPEVLVTPGNFAIGGGFQDDKRKYYRGPVTTDYVLRPGQIVVTMTDLSKQSDTLGFAARVPNDTNVWLHNQRVGLLVFNPSAKADARFVEYLLRSHEYRAWVVGSATGTTVKHTSPSRIEGFRTLVPPPDEQRAIAHILGTLDDEIELNRRRNQTLEAMACAIFKDWFVDFGPVRAKVEGREPYPPTDLRQLFPDRLDDAGKPEGWIERPLDEIADFLNGLALQKFPATNPDDSLPVIKIAELRNGVSAKSDRASRKVPSKYIIKDGNFLFSWSGSLLAKFWTEGEGALNQHLFKVTSERYPMWFVSHWVHHHLEEFQAIAASKATTMGHIQRGHLKAAMTLCPPGDVLERLGVVMAPLVEQSILNELQSRRLAQLRDTLLPKLISGELRIADAEKFIERAEHQASHPTRSVS